MQAPPKTRPAVIGLTGAIAAGKSSALGALERLGARTLSSDETVHELLTDPEVAAILHERWGEGAVPDGEVDRRRIGSIVFSDPAELAWLEGVLHPRVGERTQRWRSELPAGTELAVVEVPLLFEAGLESSFDATLVIAASDELRAERAGARGTG
ncbi:MAG: dephospho-CoA kinase, partial [Solirubrobacterales bacterium]|nr:dephospho-CoA kinase [Solirubrobacterales bacterium]